MSFDGFTPVSSDMIEGVRYDSMEKKLAVRFRNGYVYHVHGILPDDYQKFMNAPSQGQHYHQHIKDNFHVERVK